MTTQKTQMSQKELLEAILYAISRLIESGKVFPVLGLQWGDEGKGKIADLVAILFDIIARFQGGGNAGHTINVNGKEYVFHQVPSAALIPGKTLLIGDGVSLNPHALKKEIEKLREAGIDLRGRLLIGTRAKLTLPTHCILDAANENALGKMKVGTTLKGIGPTYTDNTARKAVRVGDITMGDKYFKDRYYSLKNRHLEILQSLSFNIDGFKLDNLSLEEYEQEWLDSIEYLKQFEFVDCPTYITNALNEGKKVMAEGAQGSMLDKDYGSYPFVTSSNVIGGGVCTGLGIAPNLVSGGLGIFKAYCTRVGTGPFPTERLDETGNVLRYNGHECGATTKRPRRCGWLDLPALKYAARYLNNVKGLFMMKSDVLDDFDIIKVATAYMHNGKKTEQLPYAACTETMEPVYTEFTGWKQKVTDGRIPPKLNHYVNFIEKYVGIPIIGMSIGPNRYDNIVLPTKV